MAMGSERSSPSSSSSKPLHNFNLLGLRWRSQKSLRCSFGIAGIAVFRRNCRDCCLSSSSQSGILDGDYNASDFETMIGKRKEREKFDDPYLSQADYRLGSDFNNSGYGFKSPFPHLPPTSMNTEYGRNTRLPPESGDDGDGIAAVREKLMFNKCARLNLG